MRQLIFYILILLVQTTTCSCSFHLHSVRTVPSQIKILIVTGDDLYGPLIRYVRQQLRINDINVIADNNITRIKYPMLFLNKEQLKNSNLSIFTNGLTAEYLLILTVKAQFFFPMGKSYPINLTVHRTLFNEPNTILANDAEQDIILQEMYYNAAEKLVCNILNLFNKL